MKTLFIDIECFANFFLLSCMKEEGRSVSIRMTPDTPFDAKKARWLLSAHRTVSFNGISYDLPLISAAIGGMDNKALKGLSDKLIKSKSPWQVIRNSEIHIPDIDHIDLMPIAPGKASLKLYAGRIGAHTLQDLPFNPDQELTPDQMDLVEQYCLNDLTLTRELFNVLTPQIALREKIGRKYGLDLRSKSDAQIAELVLKHELSQAGVTVRKPQNVPEKFYYKAPGWIRFDCPDLKRLLQDAQRTEFIVRNGKVTLPESLSRAVTYDGQLYNVGLGGLHSKEKSKAVRPGDNEVLFDADFASFYPSIILNEKYFPKHLGKKFLEIYQSIVRLRLKAKADGDKVTADSLKIVINSSFGKFGNQYSCFYSPDLFISTTLSGQLTLLMLIGRVTQAGAKVISANTDGLVILCKKANLQAVHEVMFDFELISGFNLETTPYSSIYFESVSSYLAVRADGHVKGKGSFAENDLMKNPQFPICAEAVREWAREGTPINRTVEKCDDINKFISVRTVNGGAKWNSELLGRVVRWYVSDNGISQPIFYLKNGNKVPRTEGAMPLMTLPDSVPADLDRKFYVNEAQKMLQKIGATCLKKTLNSF